MPRFSANLGFLWQDRPLLERIMAASAAGFRAIEVHWPYDIPPEHLRAVCEREGARLLGINSRPGGRGDFGLAALPGREAEFRASLAQAADYARRAGGSAVHILAGIVPAEKRSAARETLVANLRWAVAEASDLTLLIEPMNQRDRPGYFFGKIADALDIIDEVGAPNLKMMFDCYHIAIAEGGVGNRLAEVLPYIGHVQIAAVPNRTEPDEGDVAYEEIFAQLDELGYAGWVGCEYRPRGDTDTGLQWFRNLAAT